MNSGIGIKEMPLAKIEIDATDAPFFVDHNFPCPVCQKTSSILNINLGVFEPCRGCKKKGWSTLKTEKGGKLEVSLLNILLVIFGIFLLLAGVYHGMSFVDTGIKPAHERFVGFSISIVSGVAGLLCFLAPFFLIKISKKDRA